MTSELITRLIARYRSAAQCAAALGISRQALNASIKRGRLSDKVELHAAELLATNNNPAPQLADELHITSYRSTNYALSKVIKKTTNAVSAATIRPHVHDITSQEQKDALDLIRWVYAVARLPANSPRFCWYVSRWAVPEKISRAKLQGTFAASVANCPPIDPAWIRFVPAALAACETFKAMISRPISKAPTSSSTPAAPRNSKRIAA